jgi:hypothetical protein
MLTPDGQMSSLGLPAGETAVTSLNVSEHGRVVTGSTFDPVRFTNYRGFIWDRQEGFHYLGEGIAFTRLSDDGTTVAARILDSSLAFRWTRENGAIPLPTLPGWPRVDPYDLTPDGSIIVGELRNESGSRAFVWDEQHGTQDLRQLLINEHGFTPAQLPPQLTSAYALSADAMTLGARSDLNEQWAIYLDKPLVNVVPEPSTGALGCIGGIALFVVSRRHTLWKQRC